MKKVILSAAALLIGTFAFAQVSGAPEAEAPISPVAALPGAAADANTGTSIQNGNDNRVQVRQAGTIQSVYTEQDNGSGAGGNLARLSQTGNVGGPGNSSGVANWAEVWQLGTENQSTTMQEGDTNNAITLQGQNDDGSTGNRARIRQGVANQAEDNFAAIEQDGDYNESTIKQTFDNNDAWAKQVGDGNESRIDQDGGPNGTAGHWALVNTDGDDNTAKVVQESTNGVRNFAEIQQLGDDNAAQQMQTNDGVAANSGNHAYIDQGAGTGLADPLSTDIVSGGDISLSDADPNPSQGSFASGSFDATAIQNQSGRRNNAYVEQFGADVDNGNYAEQNQTGRRNDAYITQNAYGNTGKSGNYARQDQDGTDSRAGILQTGTGNKAYQQQDGDDNQVMSTQKYENNAVFTYQDGDGSRALTAQKGYFNKILLTQHNGQSYTVEQNMGDSFPASVGGNQADILQMGPDDTYAQELCIFPGEDTPMPFNLSSFDIDPICTDCP